MARYITVTAAVTVAEPRLRAYLRSPLAPASAWPESDWTGLCTPWPDRALRGRYLAELPAAVAECDSWLDGDHADHLLDLAEHDDLGLRHDGAGDALVLDLDTRVDFELPGMIWAFTVLRGLAAVLADGEGGLVELTPDWTAGSVPMLLSPRRSAFLDPARDAAALARARDAAFDVRCAVPEKHDDTSVAELLEQLLT
ncbi:hypothetical protein SAMN05216371_6708 [Streptomyces sp. TLI_053]|uniref:hypothetical protein n=1 Tax=Streptomyces sp. TLI_053 TaxID=1855352 RepID=UPI00087D9024|nr:hypothetical protein [Streptomyces sp. TLI_053]SDT81569.1 hypothetical protein SAMN05216371_6708 [Streptomyces sp. TLI_053]